MSCLGDTDGDGKEEVAVGAPFYSDTQVSDTQWHPGKWHPGIEKWFWKNLAWTQGAVFIFAEHNNQMKLTQKILMSEKSFGLRWAVVIFLSLFLLLRLSPDRPDKTMTVPGLGVGAPEVKNYNDGDVLKSCWHSFMKIPSFTAIFQEAKAFYLKIRPTVVFKLKPKVSLQCQCIGILLSAQSTNFWPLMEFSVSFMNFIVSNLNQEWNF